MASRGQFLSVLDNLAQLSVSADFTQVGVVIFYCNIISPILFYTVMHVLVSL